MTNAKTYIGLAALTVIRTNATGYAQVYAGDPVPEDITSEDLKRLVDEGFLGEEPATPTKAASK